MGDPKQAIYRFRGADIDAYNEARASIASQARDSVVGFISFMQAGIVETLNNRRTFNEYLIERVRLSFFAHQVSRIRGMFFFSSRSEAEARIGDPAWPPYFEIKNLLELDLYHNEPFTDLDANWITFAPLAEDGRITMGNLQWVWRYWAGEKYSDHPV